MKQSVVSTAQSRVCVCTECVNRADVVFVLDSSGSIDEPYFEHMVNFTARVVSGFDIDGGSVRVGAVAFANDVQPVFNLSQYTTRQEVQVSRPCTVDNHRSQ